MEGVNSDFILDTIRALGTAGGPVFAFLWWRADQERKACQAKMDGYLERTLTATNQAAAAVLSLKDTVTVLGVTLTRVIKAERKSG